MEDTITENLTDLPYESVVIPLIEVPFVKISQPSVSNDFLPIKTNHTMDPGLAIQQTGTTTRNTRKTTGIAFSGGGIRSAAFCSGALRRMLQDNVPLEYLSCVSGGGFTGGAFMDWKYRQETNKWNSKKTEWHNEFFERMRTNAGYLCSWQNPILGICQSILLTLVVLFVVCILPCTLWLPYALPVAAAVDFLFGEILRENCTSSHGVQQDTSSSVLMMDLYNGCQPPVNQMLLFTITATVSLACYVLSRRGNLVKYKGPLKLLSTLSGLVFAFTAFPWIAHDILWPSKIWVRFLIFFISLVFPFFFPVLRKSAGLCLRSYIYTYILSWKVFKVKLIGTVVYSDDIFYPVLMVCALFFMFFPVVRSLQQSLFNVYYRYRLTNAFFMHGAKIRCGDIFHWCGRPTDFEFRTVRDADELTLQDLEDMSPVFISNITVNDWQIAGGDDNGYQLMTFSSEGVKVIGSDVKNGGALARNFVGRFHPHLMKLSVAMAVSGAAVSFDKEGYQSRLDMALDLFALMGIQMGEEIVCDECPEAKIGWKEKITPVLVETSCIIPLIALPFVYWLANSKEWVVYLVLFHMAVAVFLATVAVLNTGAIQPGKIERFVRWCATHSFFVRFFRGFLNINNVGMNSPPVLRLSDGGHFENLALLPLLDKKLQKIVIFDGSCNSGGDEYADSLIHALNMAREKLHCSFTGLSGRDINEDIRVNFLKMKSRQRPRSYRFRVHYYDEEDNQIGEGEILFVAPRHPSESIPLERIVTEQPKLWRVFGVELDDLDHKKWGKSPEIAEQEVERLIGCCCLCCDRNSCHSFSLGRFPHHITANQFFTPDTFSAYHREGYAACVEADVLAFLKTQQDH